MNEDQEDKIEVEPVADEDIRIADPAEKIRKLKSELERSEKERKEYLDGWQRAKAEFINYKKDEVRRFEELVQFANAAFIQDILPALDSLDLAFQSFQRPSSSDQQSDERGILLIRIQLEDIMRKHGLEEIGVKAGDPFRPEAHESLGEEESDAAVGAVAAVLQKGYMIRGRVVRPARVKISKGRIQ